MIKLLLTTLTLFAPFVPQEQVYENFDTFQTVEKYELDFDYLFEKYISYAYLDGSEYEFESDGSPILYYAFPISYNLDIVSGLSNMFYSNSFYNFYNITSQFTIGNIIRYDILNYIGTQEELPFIAFTSLGMSQIIAHDKDLPVKDNTLYGSFFAFFTGFFPHSVVAEYNGIFTAIVVAFLLFLVFGFIFFLFRTIRRLMGFR